MQVCKALRHASDGQGMQFCKACICMCGYVRCRTYHKHAKRHTKRHTERQRHTHHTCGVSHLHPPFRNDLVNPVVMLRWTLEPLETAGHLHTPHRVVCRPRGRLKIPARVRAMLHAGVDCSWGAPVQNLARHGLLRRRSRGSVKNGTLVPPSSSSSCLLRRRSP